MNEVWIIHDTIVYQGERTYQKGLRPKSDWNYGFYSQETGEVYGKRIVTSQTLPWCFRPGFEPCIDLFTENLRDLPDGVFEYYVNWLASQGE